MLSSKVEERDSRLSAHQDCFDELDKNYMATKVEKDDLDSQKVPYSPLHYCCPTHFALTSLNRLLSVFLHFSPLPLFQHGFGGPDYGSFMHALLLSQVTQPRLKHPLCCFFLFRVTQPRLK